MILLDEYVITWDQNMGGGRGLNMRVVTDDWQTAQLLWRELFRDALPEMRRSVVFCHNAREFDPKGTWPRAPYIQP